MKINLNNYELYFADYLENNLTEIELAELYLFLKQNPELEIELYSAKKIKLKPEKIIFDNKNILKKKVVNIEQFNTLCVKSIEEQISETENFELQNILKNNPELQNEYKLFKSTILKPEHSIIFENKSKLKRNVLFGVKSYLIKYSAIAASVVFLLSISYFLFFNIQHINNKKLISKNSNSSVAKNKIFYSSNKLKTKKQFIVKVKENNNKVLKNNKEPKAQNNDSTFITNNIKLDSVFITNSNFYDNKLVNYEANNTIKTNNTLDTTLNAVFINNKYTHFKDMIDNVPYNNITASNNDINIWNLIKNGTEKINTITGSNIEIDKNYNKKNKTKNFKLKIGKFGFSTIRH